MTTNSYIERAKFSTFSKTIFEGNLTWAEIRLKGVELAKKFNAEIRTEVFNEALNRWDFTASCKPNGWTINTWGDILKVKADGSGYEVIHRKKM